MSKTHHHFGDARTMFPGPWDPFCKLGLLNMRLLDKEPLFKHRTRNCRRKRCCCGKLQIVLPCTSCERPDQMGLKIELWHQKPIRFMWLVSHKLVKRRILSLCFLQRMSASPRTKCLTGLGYLILVNIYIKSHFVLMIACYRVV